MSSATVSSSQDERRGPGALAGRAPGYLMAHSPLVRWVRRAPRAAWVAAAGLLLVLLAVLAVGMWGADGATPLAWGAASASTPAPTATPTPAPAVTPTPLPYAGSIVDLALAFDVEEAMVHAAELASDEYAGRQGGSPGGRAAAKYIVRQFEALGLAPAGYDGYLQPFVLPYAEEAGLPTLVITDAHGTVHDGLVFAEDYRHALGGWAAAGSAEGMVLWLGGCQPSDYYAHDARGAIVMCRDVRGVDQAARAAEEEAGALLLVTSEERRIALRRALFEAPREDGIPALWITPEVSDLLLGDAGASRTVGPLDASARVSVDLAEAGEAEGINVLAALPGNGSVQRERVLVIGAHFDHLGTDPNGIVYSGANDNASGVAVLLEIARTWRGANYRPDITVVFAAWDGEEQGLLGARHYVTHPTYPLTATKGMIQLDMVGMAGAGILTYDGEGNAVGRQLAASAALFDVPAAPLDGRGGSDHAAFLGAGVEAGLLTWDGADVPYYHTPEDTVDTLRPERLRQAGIVASHAALALIRDDSRTVAPAPSPRDARSTTWEWRRLVVGDTARRPSPAITPAAARVTNRTSTVRPRLAP